MDVFSARRMVVLMGRLLVVMHLMRRMFSGGMRVHLRLGLIGRHSGFALHGRSRHSPDGEQHCKQEQKEDAKELHERQVESESFEKRNGEL